MKFVLDTSAFMRIFPPYSKKVFTDRDNNTELVFTYDQVMKAHKFIERTYGILSGMNKSIIVLIIVLVETATNLNFHYQKLPSIDFIDELKVLCDVQLSADNEISETALNISYQFHAKGGADTLIVSWTAKEQAILITGDKNQYNKAKSIHLRSYYIYSELDRKSLLKTINEMF